MSIFSLENTKKMLDLCNSYTEDKLCQNFIYPYYNWINNYIKCNWIHSSIAYNITYYIQVCISDKGSVICILINNIEGSYYPYGIKNFFDFIPDENTINYIKNNYFVRSKFETINNIHVLSIYDKITSVIHYLPPIINVDIKYLIHINKLLEEYIDSKNYIKDLNYQHNVFKFDMTNQNIKLINKIKEKNDQIKMLTKNNLNTL